MEYLKKDELYKNRSYGRCISSGYHALMDNHRSILSYTWKAALAYFIVLSVALFITKGFAFPQDITQVIIGFVMGIAVLFSQFYVNAHIINMYTEQGKLTLFKKLIKIFLWFFIATIVISIILITTLIFAHNSEYSNIILISTFSVLFILLLVLGTPFGYIITKYLVEDEKHFHKAIAHGFAKGMNHWGLIFVTMILSVFFIFVASFLISLPLYILVIARIISSTGVMFGDESGMPSYFPLLFSVTTSIVSVIFLYFNSFLFSTLYYAYGSIEQQDNEKRGFIEQSMKD